MKGKQYVQDVLEKAQNVTENLQNDVDNNRPYATQEYLIDKLEFVKKSIILALDRIQLEDENS